MQHKPSYGWTCCLSFGIASFFCPTHIDLAQCKTLPCSIPWRYLCSDSFTPVKSCFAPSVLHEIALFICKWFLDPLLSKARQSRVALTGMLSAWYFCCCKITLSWDLHSGVCETPCKWMFCSPACTLNGCHSHCYTCIVPWDSLCAMPQEELAAFKMVVWYCSRSWVSCGNF